MFVALVADKAPQFINFGLQLEQLDAAVGRALLDAERIGQLVIDGGDEVEQPFQADGEDTADATQADPLQEQLPNQVSGGGVNVLRVLNKLSPTAQAPVILFAVVRVTVKFRVR